ncbi:MAG: c-type cytochrome [Pseudomonadota bacterium]
MVRLPSLVALLCLTAAPALAQDKGAPNIDRGRLLFKQCAACHSLDIGQGQKVGPSLQGLWGRPIAAEKDFPYSEALSGLDGTWDGTELDRFLKRPSDYAKGTTMSFAGISSDRNRRDLIAYLRETVGSFHAETPQNDTPQADAKAAE